MRRRARGTAVLAIVVSIAYLIWRATSTLGSSSWLSIPVLLLEVHAVVSLAFHLLALGSRQRQVT